MKNKLTHIIGMTIFLAMSGLVIYKVAFGELKDPVVLEEEKNVFVQKEQYKINLDEEQNAINQKNYWQGVENKARELKEMNVKSANLAREAIKNRCNALNIPLEECSPRHNEIFTEGGEVEREETGLDYQKLAYAVAMAETADCTKGSGKYNNCHGIMEWTSGKRTLVRFSSKEQSYAAFIDLWKRKYKRYPDRALAIKYSGNDHPDDWLRIVNTYYNAG